MAAKSGRIVEVTVITIKALILVGVMMESARRHFCDHLIHCHPKPKGMMRCCNFIVILCDLGRFLEAEHLVSEITALAAEMGNELDIVRVLCWLVERTHSWLNRFRRLKVRYERRADISGRSFLPAWAARERPRRWLRPGSNGHGLKRHGASLLGVTLSFSLLGPVTSEERVGSPGPLIF